MFFEDIEVHLKEFLEDIEVHLRVNVFLRCIGAFKSYSFNNHRCI